SVQHRLDTSLYDLSLHDALPISQHPWSGGITTSHPLRVSTSTVAMFVRSNRTDPTQPVRSATRKRRVPTAGTTRGRGLPDDAGRSEEHTSELQSRENIVCRLLVE